MKQYQIKLIGFVCALGLNACSDEMASRHENPSSQIVLSSVDVKGESSSTEKVADGTYYFGSTSKQDVYNYTPVKITNSLIGEVAAYWENIKLGKVSLSNSLDIEKEDKPIDLLWGAIEVSKISKLAFTLHHRMASTEIDLNIPTSWEIKSVILTDLKKQYKFSNKEGDIKTTDDAKVGEIVVEKTENTYSILLPPQEKGDNSALIVVVNDGSKDRTYSRKLPYAMAQEISKDQWEDIPLRFRAGYRLVISATIQEAANDDIQFTYATLVDWKAQNGGTASARPAGLYSVADWEAFVVAYDTKDEIRLLKYGTKSNDNWTFTVQRTIDMSGKTVTKVSDFASTDKLTAKTNCYIIGKTAAELGVEGYTDITFK